MARALEGGGGDFRREQEDDCPWDKLTFDVLRHICRYLHGKDYNHVGRLSKDMEQFILYDFGIHVLLPRRDWNLGQLPALRLVLGRLSGIVRHITDGMVKRRILNMEGKAIRSLDMHEMHPEFSPFPLKRLIQYPFRLREVSLSYVDAQFLYELLAVCRNLEIFHYKTGQLRHLPSGLVNWLLLGITFRPVPIPSENDNLIQLITQLPMVPFHFYRLRSLSLHMGATHEVFRSDWANLIFLLLVLPSEAPLVALKEFRFKFYGNLLLNLKDSLQVVACLAHFLTRCPHLQSFDYESSSYSDLLANWNRMDLTDGFPQNVMSFLIRKYGSDLLREVCQPGILGRMDLMLIPLRRLMREAGAALINLHDAFVGCSNRFESLVFQELVSCLPSSLQCYYAFDYSGVTLSNEAFSILLPSLSQGGGVVPLHRVYEGLQILYVIRDQSYSSRRFGNHSRIISLSEVLGRMRALLYLTIIPRSPLEIPETGTEWTFEDDPEYFLDPDIVRFVDENDNILNGDGNNRVPDITIEETAAPALFQRVAVLNLEGVKFTTRAAGRLDRCRNLQELILDFLPEHRHNLFGIRSGDLLRILGSLRRLEKVEVNMILFPLDPNLKLKHCNALKAIGRLRQMRRPGTEVSEAIMMQQYKFAFGVN